MLQNNIDTFLYFLKLLKVDFDQNSLKAFLEVHYSKVKITPLSITKILESLSFNSNSYDLELIKDKSRLNYPLLVLSEDKLYIIKDKMTYKMIHFINDEHFEFENTQARFVISCSSFNENKKLFNFPLFISNILRLISDHKSLFLTTTIASTVVVLTNTIFPFSLEFLIDRIIPYHLTAELYTMVIFLIFSSLIISLISFLSGLITLKYRELINLRVQSNLFSQIIFKNYINLKNLSPGHLLNRYNQSEPIAESVSNHITSVTMTLISSFVFTIILSNYSIYFLLLPILAGLLFTTIQYYFKNYISPLLIKEVDISSKLISDIGFASSNMPMLKSYNLGSLLLNNIDEKIINLSSNFALGELKNYNKDLFIVLIRSILHISFITFSVNLYIQNILSAGEVFAINIFINKCLDGYLGLTELIISTMTQFISANHIGEILTDQNAETKNVYVPTINHIDLIQVKNLTFAYKNDQKVLKNINLELEKNKIIAIVGSNGSGKSTLLKIISGALKQDSNSIYVNNEELNSLSTQFIRDKIAYLGPNESIFSGSIKENIVFNTDHFDEERYERACHLANIYDFTSHLVNKDDTQITNEGGGISNGQKQRLVLARLFYEDPDVVLFDETTSALDIENNSIIKKNFPLFFRDKICVIVTHKLKNIEKADLIYVLKDGQVVQQGQHQQLSHIDGHYKELLNQGKANELL